MSNRKSVMAAIRQVLLCISQDNPIPKGNKLLQSPLVLDYLNKDERSFATEERQTAIEDIFKQLINEYGLEQPEGRRQQELHRKIFDVLFYKVRGQSDRLGMPKRTYERWHAEGIRILTDRFLQKEADLLNRNSGDNTPQKLAQARQLAQEMTCWLTEHPSCLDLFILADLAEVATIIADHDYWSEVQDYFKLILIRLETAPNNSVILSQQLWPTRQLGHSLMNQGKVRKAAVYFNRLAKLANELGDLEQSIHGAHMMGVTYNLAGNWNPAINHLEIALAKAFTNHRKAWIQRDIISASITKGDFKNIPKLAKESLSTRDRLGDALGCMMTLEIWGKALLVQQKYTLAETKLAEALNISYSLSVPDVSGSILSRTQTLATLAQLYYTWGLIDKGAEYAKEALKLVRRHGFWHLLKNLEYI